MITVYSYKLVKEDFHTGKRAERTRKYESCEPLAVNGLYMHLGKGYPGAWRVLELVKERQEEY